MTGAYQNNTIHALGILPIIFTLVYLCTAHTALANKLSTNYCDKSDFQLKVEFDHITANEIKKRSWQLRVEGKKITVQNNQKKNLIISKANCELWNSEYAPRLNGIFAEAKKASKAKISKCDMKASITRTISGKTERVQFCVPIAGKHDAGDQVSGLFNSLDALAIMGVN
jgi:putative lipase involved disintegration of autophagic bodies